MVNTVDYDSLWLANTHNYELEVFYYEIFFDTSLVYEEDIRKYNRCGEGYSNGCHREGMLKEHINSQAFRKSFSKVRLKKYRESLQLPIIDNIRPGGNEKLSIEGKIAFLGPKKDINDILEAFIKVTKNIDKLT